MITTTTTTTTTTTFRFIINQDKFVIFLSSFVSHVVVASEMWLLY